MNKSDTDKGDTTNDDLNSNENQLIDEYGITTATKTIYHYQEYSYDRLKDALAYAKIDSERNLATSGDHSTHTVKEPDQ